MMNQYEQIEKILKNYRQELIPLDRDASPKVQGTIPFIHKHIFDSKLTITWLKEQCNINRKSFSAQFKAYCRFWPKEYIIYHRLEASKRLLDQTVVLETQIALSVGFHSLAAFCNTFKHKEGVRPSKWREQSLN